MVNQNVTTIIVSHQLERIAFLCKREVLLRRGEVAHAGPAAETIAEYVSGVTEETQEYNADCPVLIRRAELVTDGRTTSGSRILIRVDADVVGPAQLVETCGVGVRVRLMQNGKVLFATSTLRARIVAGGVLPVHTRGRSAAQHRSRHLHYRDSRLRPKAQPTLRDWSVGERDRV